jgi:hypothetical protein
VANCGKVIPKSSGQANTYNNFDNVGYGKYGNVSLGGITFLITTHFQVMWKEFLSEDWNMKKPVYWWWIDKWCGFTLGIGYL